MVLLGYLIDLVEISLSYVYFLGLAARTMEEDKIVEIMGKRIGTEIETETGTGKEIG